MGVGMGTGKHRLSEGETSHAETATLQEGNYSGDSNAKVVSFRRCVDGQGQATPEQGRTGHFDAGTEASSPGLGEGQGQVTPAVTHGALRSQAAL